MLALMQGPNSSHTPTQFGDVPARDSTRQIIQFNSMLEYNQKQKVISYITIHYTIFFFGEYYIYISLELLRHQMTPLLLPVRSVDEGGLISKFHSFPVSLQSVPKAKHFMKHFS